MKIVNSYDPTAYYLRFFKELRSENGDDVRLEILRKVEKNGNMVIEKPYPQEIANLSALSLSLEGNGEIDDPITKSTLSFSIVEDNFKINEIDVKHNDFTELYTPDSTAFLVVLKTSKGANEWQDRWRGYLTPDSWQEDLESYGSIQFSARDNIGHLADLDFDYYAESGTIAIGKLLEEAMKRIALPMELRYNTDNEGEAVAVTGGDVDLMSASVALVACKDKTWLSAVEDALASLGMTLRYTDDASVTVMYLANLPLYGNTQRKPALDIIFHGGTKSLMPAYREIKSECDYGAEEDLKIDIIKGLEYGEDNTYSWEFKSTKDSFWNESGTGIITPIQGDRVEGWQKGSKLRAPGVFSPAMMDNEAEDSAENPLIAANDVSHTTYAAYRMLAGSSAVTLQLELSSAVSLTNTGMMFYARAGELYTNVVILLENGNKNQYWNGERWGNDLSVLEFVGNNIEIALEGVEMQPNAAITIFFDKVEFKGEATMADKGLYTRLMSLKVSSNAQLLEKDTVTTINNEAYNVRAERNLAIGAMSQQMKAFKVESYPNALWDMTTQDEFHYFPYQCFLGSDYTKTYPLPALVHRQLLMFHHVAQPQLSGTCTIPAGARFDRLYSYKGVNYLLQGANLDLFSGRMEDITLRGFIAYNDLWK